MNMLRRHGNLFVLMMDGHILSDWCRLHPLISLTKTDARLSLSNALPETSIGRVSCYHLISL